MINSVSPNQISKGTAGTVITISGSGFDNTAAVSFENGSGITPQITSTVFVNAETLTIQVDVASKGKTDSWDLRVTQGDGSALLNNAITITK